MARLVSSIRLIALSMVALSLLVSGCSGKGKATKANFEKIKEGASLKDVETLMGPAAQTLDAKAAKDLFGAVIPGMGEVTKSVPDKVLIWKDAEGGYEVDFKDDKVSNKKSLTKDELTKFDKEKSDKPDTTK